eukprot:m51a1_g3385 putative rho guanine nucleotide exchange factor 17 (676) ;mRNA; r:500481-502834
MAAVDSPQHAKHASMPAADAPQAAWSPTRTQLPLQHPSWVAASPSPDSPRRQSLRESTTPRSSRGDLAPLEASASASSGGKPSVAGSFDDAIIPPPPLPPPVQASDDIDIPPPPLPVDIPPPPLEAPPASAAAGAAVDIPPPAVDADTEHLLKRRRMVAKEVCDTERTYVKSLGFMVDVYMARVKAAMPPSFNLYDVFANAETIRTIHAKFLAQLDACFATWNNDSTIGKLFLATEWIKLYKYYVNNYGNAVSVVKNLKETNKAFKDVVSAIDYTAEVEGQYLESLLVLPIQRIPRYVLLLGELHKSTPSGHPDIQFVVDAEENIQEFAVYINDRKRLEENVQQLRDIQQSWEGFDSDLTAGDHHREFLHSFAAVVNGKKRRLWLMSDMLVVTKPGKKGTSEFLEAVKLDTLGFQIDDSQSNAFKLISPSGVMACQMQDADYHRLESAAAKARDTLLQSAFGGQEKSAADKREQSRRVIMLQEQEAEQHRKDSVLRLIATEKGFIEEIHKCCTSYLAPLSQGQDVPQSAAACVEKLLAFFTENESSHRAFLAHLEAKVEAWSAETTLTDVLEEFIGKLQCYNCFVEKVTEHVRTIESAQKESRTFAAALIDLERQSMNIRRVTSVTLKHLPGYYLAARELMRYTPQKHPDHDGLTNVITIIETMQQSLNMIGGLK